ncbi:Colanic acid biosynthesis protein WcaK [Salinisphaera shabanensis E1L3A]|uniref:Colanic acid biosynthesis protein WcaK n=1 Tax=Salinisphaera shabanensis E1L3A TaxID=1033802 RepID=U2FT13_9GAMM|nr:polysaccharide pyruvyl transferase family protein [Salinisphaera shabanensis]ERJ17543.1 Colanic acid biosynthesis protein WcaK [Salinisphaera shabanensis E1L3A]
MITIFCIQPKGFNVGNAAINLAMKRMAYEQFGRLVNLVSIPATPKYDGGSLYGLSRNTIHQINRMADGVIIGGGNLFENDELFIDKNALRSLMPPMMIFSVSRGRIYNRFGDLADRTDVIPDDNLKAVCQRADYVLARDAATMSYLSSLNIEHALEGGCPTVQLCKLSSELPPLPAGEDVGALVSIRSPSLMNIPIRLQSTIPGLVRDLVETLRHRGYRRVRLVCHDPRDLEFANSFPGVDAVYTSDVREYLSLLAAAELAVSFRLHATLPCFSFGVPAVNISYDERAKSLLETIGLSDWDIDLVESDSVVEDVTNRLDNIEVLSESVQKARDSDWNGTVRTMVHSMSDFATDVANYARTGKY